MKISGIYKIQSIANPDRCYIGSAIKVNHRWNCHLSDLRLNKHHSQKLQRHFNKYGESDLQFSVLLGCEKENLIKTEQYFIDSYNPYFNGCKIAGSPLGTKHSLECNKRQSERNKGKHYSEKTEFKKGLVPWSKGKKMSAEFCKKGSIAHMGNKSALGHTCSDEARGKMRDVKINNPVPLSEKARLTLLAYASMKHSVERNKKSSEVKKGNKNPMFGKHPSIETREKTRNALKLYWENKKSA